MKKFILTLTALALILCAMPALAMEEMPFGEVVALCDGQQIDLDGDGTVETIDFSWENTDDAAFYNLAVGDLVAEPVEDCWYLSSELYAVRFTGIEGAMLMVADYGPSDDPATFVYHYLRDFQGYEKLDYLGCFYSLPEQMTVTGPTTFTAYVRGNKLMTWFRPADFVIAAGYFDTDDMMEMRFGLAEVPRDLYPMGAYVTLNRELPLKVSRTNGDIAMVLEAGTECIVSATDDREWIYIAPAQWNWSYDYAGGWVKMDAASFCDLIIDGELVPSYEVMDGLLFAD